MVRWLLFFSLMAPAMVNAQSDSTSTILLKRGGTAPKAPKLDSSRYRVRQPESRKTDPDDLEEKPGTYIPSPVPPRKNAQPVTPLPAPVPVTSAPAETTQPKPETKPQTPVTVQVKELILGGSNEEIDQFKKTIHPEDPRANVITISMAPAYYYNDSRSDYSFRRYHSNGLGIGLGMNVWITPFFGLQSKFFSSVSASQRSGGVNSVPVDIQAFEAGVRFRKYFGVSLKAPHLRWGLDYHDSMNKISKASTTSIGRKSSGLSLVLEGEMPSSNTYAHTFQLDVRPRLKHSEMTTGVEARTGTKNETNAIGLSVGGQWTMDRSNQVFWRGQYLIEKNLFDGPATLKDPHTDQTPSGVSVNNTLVIFYFGFKWGS